MKKSVWLRISLLVLMLAVMLSSCAPDPCVEHIDLDGDFVCDVCSEQLSPELPCEHEDSNGDYICDICNESLGQPPCTSHTDTDGDDRCDNCGEYVEPEAPCTSHTDTDGDEKCDNCGEHVEPEAPCTSHTDTDGDEKCDNCGESVPAENNGGNGGGGDDDKTPEKPALSTTFDYNTVPKYSGSISVKVNGGVPFFTSNQYTTISYEYYGARDALGRCTVTVACIGRDLMPTSERGSISSVSPTGWHSNGIYERAHLIAHCLTGEDVNWENLISGTYDLNGEMPKYENMVADYIKETGNHVLYRVTPIFEGNNLLASGVLMEGWSVEDNGAGICFCVFIYNVEGDYEIDYATGDFRLTDDSLLNTATFVVNKNKYKIHKADCRSVTDMSDANKIYYYGTYDEVVADLIGQGKNYSNCGSCHPENG